MSLRLPQPLGKTLYVLALPASRFWLGKTRRVYVLVRSADKVLVVKNWFSRQLWQMPGGGIKRTETAEAAAVREIHEELGIKLDSSGLKPLLKDKWQTDRLNHNYRIFLADLKNPAPVVKKAPELSDTAWLPATQLNSSNALSELLAAIKAAKL